MVNVQHCSFYAFVLVEIGELISSFDHVERVRQESTNYSGS